MSTKKRRKPACKIWIEHQGKPLVGKGGAEILEAIEKEKSITKAAVKLEMSYRYVWNYLKKIGRTLGKPVIETYRGGQYGGGGARLTNLGKSLLNEYRRIEGYLGEILCDGEYWEAVGLKISARNRIKGKIKLVEKGVVTAKIRIEISTPTIVTALITREATEELNLKIGDKIEVVIKATEVIVAKV